ncbi:MAG: cysteine rich repeat-containing protein [Parvibaculum sp.]|uniref:cysteine rich repeat-containing protein n=1 Tax=Parvibaculum sp. TaxID=2024848 RepID=UPI0025D0CA9E|nr:cysteine rich repeat-containing protein [Parvibaculum sp.]MCE9649665.1 cysteine rich repeat-containing protein [Parvibaculum sp.]
MKSNRIFAALGAIALVLTFSSAADAGRLACRGDFKKYCSAEEPGTGKAVACMREHFDELSDGCKEYIKEMKAEKAANEAESHAQQ